MTYSITIFHQGTELETYDGYEAPNALVAIDRLIADKFSDLLKPVFFIIDKNKPPVPVDWTGLEFQARSLKMTLS